MTKYVNVKTKQVFELQELAQQLNASLCEGVDLTSFGYKHLTETPKPSVESGFIAYELPPVNYTQRWAVRQLTNEEKELALAESIYLAKMQRQTELDALTVTTQSGKTFNGDEISQTRMTRAILALQATNTPSITWVLADNVPTEVTVGELVEALSLAGVEQAAIWVRPYQ